MRGKTLAIIADSFYSVLSLDSYAKNKRIEKNSHFLIVLKYLLEESFDNFKTNYDILFRTLTRTSYKNIYAIIALFLSFVPEWSGIDEKFIKNNITDKNINRQNKNLGNSILSILKKNQCD